MIRLFASLTLLWASSATALEPPPLVYGDWRVDFEAYDSVEDDWLICSARTGGDGLPSLVVAVFEGDGGPPLVYPSIWIEESAPRHYPTLMQDGKPGYIVFEDGSGAWSSVETYTDEDGIEQATLAFYEDTQPLLRAMIAGMRADVVAGDHHVLQASLRGFTAAYLKMMELCGFDGTGVVD